MSRHESNPGLDVKAMTLAPGQPGRSLVAAGAVVGVAGLAGSLALAAGDPRQFYFSWLVSFLFFLSLALGGLFFVLTHFATNASWSVVVRRMGETTMATLPLFVLLFLPVVWGLGELYHWTDAAAVAHDPLLEGKSGYLNPRFFLIRAAVYLASWALLGWWFLRRSRIQDTTGDPRITRRLIQVSAPSLFVFAITVSFAAIDWVMSLDPHWYSTMFGVYFFSGCLVGIFAFMILLTVYLGRGSGLGRAVSVEHFHDLGKLLFAFTVFWAYIGFSQYFLIWYANIPEETIWYRERAEGGWSTLTLVLALGHFAVPFFFLMSRHIKRRSGLLVAGCLWMLAMHWIDLYWLVMPNLHAHDVHLSPLDLTAFAAVGGPFMAFLGWQLRRQALVPVRDPRLAVSLGFENL